MKVKDIINVINVFDIDIHFDSKEEMFKKFSNGISLIFYFSPLNEKEIKKYENSQNKYDYISSTPSIHVPDLTIDELINTFECSAGDLYNSTCKFISEFFIEDIPKDVVFVVFLFLHEVGHWMQFKKMDNHVCKYIDTDRKESENNYYKLQLLCKKRQERISKGNLCNLTTNEKKAFEQIFTEYRQIPKEKEADEFAISQIKNILKIYKDNF